MEAVDEEKPVQHMFSKLMAGSLRSFTINTPDDSNSRGLVNQPLIVVVGAVWGFITVKDTVN